MSLLTGCQDTPKLPYWFSRYSKGPDTFRTRLVFWKFVPMFCRKMKSNVPKRWILEALPNGLTFQYPTWCLIPNTWIFRTAVKKQEGRLSEKPVVIYQTTRRLISHDLNIYHYCCQEVKSGICSFTKLGRCLTCSRQQQQVQLVATVQVQCR